MTDIEAKRKRSEELDEGNGRSYNELRQKLGPQFVMDATPKRLAKLIEHLKLSGVWDEEQYLDFEIAFHEDVEEALNDAWRQVREKEAASKIVTPQKPTHLVDRFGKKLT